MPRVSKPLSPAQPLRALPSLDKDRWYISRCARSLFNDEFESDGLEPRLRPVEMSRVLTGSSVLNGAGIRILELDLSIMRHLVMRGRRSGTGIHRWEALKGHSSIIQSLAHELSVDRSCVSKALNRLVRDRIIVVHEGAVFATPYFHALCAEITWRRKLIDADSETVSKLLKGHDWEWLSKRVDRMFETALDLSFDMNPSWKDHRKFVLRRIWKEENPDEGKGN